MNEKVEERRDELLALTKELAEKSAVKRFEPLDETRGRKVKEVEDDAFFMEEEIDTADIQKRVVDKKGNVL